MKHYLVCGGAGFIGINLCNYLINLGHQVTCVDNMYCGDCGNLSREVTFYNIDIRSIMERSMLFSDIDGIFNLACPASPKNYQRDPFFTIDTCTRGVYELLELAKLLDIPLLQSSTSEIYGNATVTPQSEDYNGNVNCTGIRACYDEGKRLAETICFDHNRKFGTKIRVVRIFNTYGPYMARDDGRVISNFITQSIENKNLTIYGDGKQTRSFCYVDDMVRGLVKAIESPNIGPINLGNPDERSIENTAEIIIKLTGQGGVEYMPLPQDDPVRRRPDITKARNLLKWEPVVEFEDGIQLTIEYFNRIRKIVY